MQEKETKAQGKEEFYVVGIGASAGGFEALKNFFQNLPENPGAAFVVIQHLSPNYESSSNKILAQYTKLPVLKVTEAIKMQANHVYVLPENKELKVTDTTLYLEDRNPQRSINLAVDVFFETLANTYKERAIGIVLSGAGSDGARGAQIIKERGGMVMVQNPHTAGFDSMPLVAISADSPDYIDTPEVLAKELVAFIQTPRLLNQEKLINDTHTRQRDTLQEIIQHVSTYSGINFKTYKSGTIIRRIEKRMKINHLENLEEYDGFLRSHSKEAHHLFKNLLIGVTRFFRDGEAYQALMERAIPEICKGKKPFDPVRVWTAACSTGEEAYSIAILIDEYILAHNLNLDYKIFATDVDEKAIEIASGGRYTTAIEADISPERLNRYFNKIGDYYEVKKDLRRHIIFSKHNLLSDPPFIRLDLITCRNLFIYLMDDIQDKVLHNFNYSLKQEGFLFLGVNESINEQDNLFEAVDQRNKLFKSKPNSISRPIRPATSFSSELISLQYPSHNHYRQRTSLPPANDHYADLLAEKFAPPALIVNQHEDVVYTNGNVQKYLQFPNRRSDLHVYSMLRGNLILIFRNGLRQLGQGDNSILFTDCIIEDGAQTYKVDINFSFLENEKSDQQERLVLVEFLEKEFNEQEDRRVKVVTYDSYSRAEIENLEMELKLARQELRFTSDELETINEELQSSNEEMQSANEELQSTNEELQSSNEELQAVNIELKNKIDTITILHDDVNNLFNSTQIATVFLDSGMNIRKFTPPAKHYFNIRETDIGRPISHYSYNFMHQDIVADVQLVLERLIPLEREVEHKEGSYSIMRILPYKTESLQIKGVVITFTDITEIKNSNNKLLKLTEEIMASERHLKSLLDHTPDFIVRYDRKLRYSFVNKALLEASGLSYKEFIGKEQVGLKMLKEDEEAHRLMREVIEKRGVRDYYHSYTGKNGKRHRYVKLVPEFGEEDGKVQSILSVSTDITELKNAENKLVDKNKILSEIYDRMDNFVHAIAHDLRTPMVNLKMLAELFYKTENEEERQEFIQLISNSVNKLDNTLNGLIKIIEVANEGDINYRQVSFADAVQNVVFEFKRDIEKQDVQIRMHFEECPSIRYADVYLNSILQNLISNAIKYRHPERKPIITISTRCQDDYIVLSISDNGLGFDVEAVQNSLFKPFKRFHPGASGMGVGLYIIRYMVERNGGKIEVQSKPDEGTRFTLYLKPYDKENYTFDR